MSGLKRRKSLLYKYFICYVIIFIIPLFILGTLFYNNAADTLKNEIENHMLDRMYRVRDTIDEMFLKTTKITLKISYDEKLKPGIVERNEFYSVTAIQQIRNHWDNSFIDYMLIRFNNSKYLFSNTGRISMDTLFEYLPYINGKDRERFETDIGNMNSSLITGFDSDNSNYIVCFMPVPYGNIKPYGTAAFIINEQTFVDIDRDLMDNKESVLYIFTENSKALAVLGNRSFLPEHEHDDILGKIQKKGISGIEYKGQDLSVINITSTESGLRYVLLMSTRPYLSSLNQTRKQIMGTLALIVLLGLALSGMVAQFNYRPIKSLLDSTLIHLGINDFNGKDNEIDQIKKSFEDIIRRNMGLSEHIKIHKSMVKEQLLFMLLRGNINGVDNIRNLMNIYGIIMNHGFYIAAVISAGVSKQEDTDSNELMTKVSDTINSSIKNKNYYLIEMLKGDFAVIINTGYENCSRIFIENLFKSIQMNVRNELGSFLSIGVGKAYSEIPDLKKSFNEALTALEHEIRAGKDKILFYEDVCNLNEMVYWYPERYQDKLTQCIRQGNFYNVKDTINEIITSIKENNISIGMTKTICFGMIRTVIEVLNELNIKGFENDIEDLADFGSLDEINEKMQRTLYSICMHINEKKESHNEVLKIAIIDYINSNYTDSLFSLEMVAEKFNLSVKYLSRFFKQQFGVNYVEYLISLRINHAKKMLLTSDSNVKDIISQIGYSDAASFTRLFKKYEGITPGEYRKTASVR